MSPGEARQSWSVSADGGEDNGADGDRPIVSGRHSRQLLWDLEHTAAVQRFIAALNRQARKCGWDVEQLDPHHRVAGDDELLQPAGLVSYTLLQQEAPTAMSEAINFHLAFGILNSVLDRRACPQAPRE